MDYISQINSAKSICVCNYFGVTGTLLRKAESAFFREASFGEKHLAALWMDGCEPLTAKIKGLNTCDMSLGVPKIPKRSNLLHCVRIRKWAEYCFESTVSEKRPH